MKSLIHEEVTSKITASAFEVYNQLGTGFLEKVYENALKIELELRDVIVETHKEVVVSYKESKLDYTKSIS